jgi:hypothetical protein
VSSLQQEVSKPVMIAVVAIAVILIGLIGWWFLGRTPGATTSAAPPGMGGGPGMPGMVPGQAPPGPGGMPGQAPGRTPYPATGSPR